jgi:hypothetical protein
MLRFAREGFAWKKDGGREEMLFMLVYAFDMVICIDR